MDDDDNDELLEGTFPQRKGRVDVVSWQVTEEIEYRLFYGRLFRRWGIASWGLVTLDRGAVVREATYDNRPREFTRDALIRWLFDSGLDAGAATQLAELAVEAREDLFPGDQSEGGDAGDISGDG